MEKVMEIFSGFILMMFMGGEPAPTEFTPRDSLSHCLSTKRKVLRNQGSGGPQWVCKQGKIEMQKINNKMHPIKLLED